MKIKSRSKLVRSIKWAFIIVVILAICHFAIPIMFPWSPINCQHQDVDITTGKLRYTRYYMYCKISERIENSAITETLPVNIINTAKPEWHRVNTFSPGSGHSPHYTYHGTISQIRTLENTWEMFNLPENIRTQTALHILALWQHDSDDFLANEYIHALYDLAGNKNLATLATLTMPFVETNGTQVTQTVFYPNGQAMDTKNGYLNPSGKFIHHGHQFEWDHNGKLTLITTYNRGQLLRHESDNLEQHPGHEAAQQLFKKHQNP